MTKHKQNRNRRVHRLWTIPTFVVLLVLNAAAFGAGQKPLVIARIVDSPLTDMGMHILKDAYHRLGIEVAFRLLPGARALKSSNVGVTDGELFRVDGMSERYPNLIEVPVPIARTDFVVFTRLPPFALSGYSSLKSFSVAFRQGMKIVERGTAHMERYMVSDPNQAFRMLDRGRVDIVIENRLTGLKVMREMGIRNVSILDPPLDDEPLYHYLHKSHAALVPKLAAVLEEMHRDGEIQRLKNETEKALTN